MGALGHAIAEDSLSSRHLRGLRVSALTLWPSSSSPSYSSIVPPPLLLILHVRVHFSLASVVFLIDLNQSLASLSMRSMSDIWMPSIAFIGLLLHCDMGSSSGPLVEDEGKVMIGIVISTTIEPSSR